MLLRKPRWTLWPTRSWQTKPQKRVKSEKTSCPHTGCDKITGYAGTFLSECRSAARGRECSAILAWKPELRRKFRSDGTAQHITGDLLKYILAVGNDKSVFADHLCQLGSAAECAAWAVCPALCLPLLGLFVLLSAGRCCRPCAAPCTVYPADHPLFRRRVAGALRAVGSALSVRGRCSGACGARSGEAIAGNARHSGHQRTLTNKKSAGALPFAGMLRRFWV